MAVATALNDLGGQGDKFFVKWPNDVMAMDRKVAGILIESVARFPDRKVVGIGINLSNCETLVDQQDSTKIDAVSIQQVLGKTLSHLEILESIWKQFHTVQLLRDSDWRTKLKQIDFLENRSLTIQQGQRILSGRYQGIGPLGELLLLSEKRNSRSPLGLRDRNQRLGKYKLQPLLESMRHQNDSRCLQIDDRIQTLS